MEWTPSFFGRHVVDSDLWWVWTFIFKNIKHAKEKMDAACSTKKK
jgi:hypothetical protein